MGSFRPRQVADRFRHEPSVLILGISGKADRPDMVRDLMRAKKATYRTLLDADNLSSRSFAIGDLPMFFVVRPDGTIHEAFVGAPFEREAEFVRQLDEAVARRNEAEGG